MLERTFPLTPDVLERLRAEIGAHVGPLLGLPAEVDAVVLAVDEALQNVLRHGYGATGGWVRLTVHCRETEIEFRIRDFAPPADHAKIRPRSLDALRPGGLGTHLIRSIMDHVEYAYPQDGPGNLLILKKKIGHGQTKA